MPYGPTHKEIKICLMGLFTKKNICLMGLITNNKYMPYGPTCKEKYLPYGPTYKQQIYALWAYFQRIIFCCPMSLCA